MNNLYFIFLLYKFVKTTRNYYVDFTYELSPENEDFFVKKPANEYSKKYLLNEKCVYEKLNHPYILEINSINSEKDEVFELQFENCGCDLKAALQYSNFFNDYEKIAILRMLLDVVNYLHSNKLIHNNLVVGSILIKGKQLKLGNFAFSTFSDQTTEIIYENIDNIGFCHNEILFGHKPEFSDDIFDLGCIIEELFEFNSYTSDEIKDSFTLREAHNLVNRMKDSDSLKRITVQMALESKIFRLFYGFIKCFCRLPNKKFTTHNGIYEKRDNVLSRIFLNEEITIKCDCLCFSTETEKKKSKFKWTTLISCLPPGYRCCRVNLKNVVVTINGVSNCLLHLKYDDLLVIEEFYNKFFFLNSIRC